MPPVQRPCRVGVLLVLVALVTVTSVGPVVASPAPVTACPPCSWGFTSAAQSHGLETDVAHSEATVVVDENGSATWTARVVPTNDTVLDRLRENATLARAVASESFGVRYGSGIRHELISATVEDGAYVTRYRTMGVVRDGVLGSTLMTYFRDSPGEWVYTDLGADSLTVVAPEGTTIARGFGDVDGSRMTATQLPDTQDGPFVVFVPEGSAVPGLRGTLAVLAALGGVIVRNVLLFVALPGSVFVGGLATVRRLVDASAERRTSLLASLVAGGGALLLAATLYAEGDTLPAVTGNLLVGVAVGVVLVALGVSATPSLRERVTTGRLVGGGLVAGVAVYLLSDMAMGIGDSGRTLAFGVALLPAIVGLGRADAHRDGRAGRWLSITLAVTVVVGLLLLAPLTALGGTLFVLRPVLLTIIALAVVLASIPLYTLGGASVTAAST